MNDKKYYWLKLEENYFDLKIQKALRRLPSGSDMLICYLKMQLRYLNTGGIIEYQGIYEELAQEIALDIDEEEDLVKMTLSVLEKWKVIEPCDSGIYIAEMQERIGSKTDVALRVARHRERQKMLHCNNDETKSNSIKEIEIEKEIDKEKEQETKRDIDDVVKHLEKNFVRTISPLEYEKLKDWLRDFNENMIKHAIDLAILNNKKTFSYIAGILKNWKSNGYRTLADVKEEKIKKEDMPTWVNEPIQENTEQDQEEFDDILSTFK